MALATPSRFNTLPGLRRSGFFEPLVLYFGGNRGRRLHLVIVLVPMRQRLAVWELGFRRAPELAAGCNRFSKPGDALLFYQRLRVFSICDMARTGVAVKADTCVVG
jgi:hypothetical protein